MNVPQQKRHVVLSVITVGMLLFTGCTSGNSVTVEPMSEYTPKPDLELIQSIRKNKDASKELYEVYRDLTLIDIHNHDAGYPAAVSKWGQYGIDRIVLFGDISEPSAQATDQLAWDQYRKEPAHVYPSFAGFPIYEEEGLSIVKDKLEQGYLNIGEIAAASTYSPVVSKVEWKAKHPNDGYFPQIYGLAAKYRVPILLHIDPPNGPPISDLEKALEQHPDTIIIFGHANAYNDPSHIKNLLAKHPNVYIDFFAGFTAYNPESTNKLQDFIPLMEEYPDRFMLSTDSGYGLTTEQAAKALYETIDLLTPETALKIASQNYERLIELQPPTDTQIKRITALSAKLGKKETYRLNKRMANELIFKLESKS
ncbi:amidohydrolase family protein [Paenibacillus sp. GCM10027629]|uniref:amidohydrolase family protein n=1 Tax=Paenibacillus sp. GCM10027629 TaxID=3273414 RepID=UPI00362CC9B1